MRSPAPGAARSAPCLLSLDECAGQPVGGKALGLARLAALGLPVPPTLVLLGAGGPLPEDVVRRCLALGPPLAVRSSAQDEDGAGASFAGQFESRLGVADEAALREAVSACLAAAGAASVAEYRRELAGAGGDGASMALVVQRMIQPRAAGALFTADPVSGARDRLVVSATSGLGEALLAGHSAADEYALGPSGELLASRPASAAPVLGPGDLRALHEGARAAEAAFGCPLDLEWAIDGDGALYWLQARPITTLGGPEIDELDTPIADPRHLYTRCNVGEMLPGAVTPLTLSVFGQAIEDAFQEMTRRIGIPRADAGGRQYVANFSGHLFFNLSGLHAFETYILGAGRREADIAVVGRVVCDGPPPPREPEPLPTRARNGLRYVRALRGAWDEVLAIEGRVRDAQIEGPGDARERLRRIEAALPLFSEVSTTHLLCSGASGALHGVIVGVLSGGQPPTAEQQAQAAALLRDIPGIESAEMAAELQAIAARIAEAGVALGELAPERALAWLRGAEAGPVGEAFARFLSAHGHRCVREAELRQRDWAEDPLPLVEAVQTALRGVTAAPRPRATRTAPFSLDAALAPLPLPARLILRRVVPWARQAVARRERSKSIFVLYISRLKRAYRGLAEALRAQGRLADPDLLYFLQQPELAELVAADRPDLGRRALRRRRLLAQQAQLLFPDVATGKPCPIDLAAVHAAGEALQGVPVCQGVAVGPARVARTPAEAAALQPGEILVVPHTDVGWTPFYGVAAGLATDTGSALSHGAVVAREHGLPSVVNLRTATHRFRTGDRVVLDGAAGTLAPAE